MAFEKFLSGAGICFQLRATLMNIDRYNAIKSSESLYVNIKFLQSFPSLVSFSLLTIS